MNHAQFVIGLFEQFKHLSKEEVCKTIRYLYGDYGIETTVHGLHIFFVLRDKSKLWIQEERLSLEMSFFMNEGELSYQEWKGNSFPWEERSSSTKERIQGEGRSDKTDH